MTKDLKLSRPEMFEIIKDFMGWTLIDKHNNKTYYNFLSKEEALKKAEAIAREIYVAGGVVL